MGEAIGKLIGLVVDSLTPRWMRVLMVAIVAANAYGWWLHEQALAEQREARMADKVEMAGLRSDIRAMVSRADEGNAELRAIRQWLIQNGRNGR